MKEIKITAPGKYVLNNQHSLSKSIIHINGSLGGATAGILIYDAALADAAALASPSQTEIRHGSDILITLEVVGGSPDLVVRCTGLH